MLSAGKFGADRAGRLLGACTASEKSWLPHRAWPHPCTTADRDDAAGKPLGLGGLQGNTNLCGRELGRWTTSYKCVGMRGVERQHALLCMCAQHWDAG